MTNFLIRIVLAVVAMGLAGPAMAAETDACPADHICATDPARVLSAVQDAGYKAKLGKDSGGDPMIESSASGYNFDIFFYGCKAAASCTSLQFRATFSQDGANTIALANKWNLAKRFGQAAVDDKGVFRISYDFSTAGGVNTKNFADVVDWWATMLGELKIFFDANPAPKK